MARRRREGAVGGLKAPPTPPRDLASDLDRIPPWLPPLTYLLLIGFFFREFIFSRDMLFGSDTLGLGYMARDFFAEALRSTGFPLWNPILLGGTPFIESLAGGDSLYPLSVLLLLLLDTHRALGWKLILHLLLAGIFMAWWLRMLGRSRTAAWIAGASYLLAPSMVTLVFPGHDGKLFVAALTPLLFGLTEWSLRRPGGLPLASLSVAIALVILTTHFQMAYFLFGALGLYRLVRGVERVRGGGGWGAEGRGLLTFLAFSLLGAGASAVQLIPAVDYVLEDSRRAATTVTTDPATAREYSASWSLHPEEALGLLVPEFVGSSVGEAGWSAGTYWGRNPFKLNHEYLGIVGVLLAMLAFLSPRDRVLRWTLLGIGGGALLFAMGAYTPVWRLFYEFVPGISLFRAPSMAIFLTAFAAATLAGMGVDEAFARVDAGEGRRVLRILGGGAGVLGVGWLLTLSGLLPSLWTSLLAGEMTPPRWEALDRALPFLAQGFLLATSFAAAITLLWWAHERGWIPRWGVAMILVGGVVVDQGRIITPFIRTIGFQAFATPDANEQFLMGELSGSPEPFRLFSILQGGQDVRPGMFGIELAGGHHPNDLLRYRELIGMEGSGIPERLATFHSNVLRLLNVEYILWPDAQYGALEGLPRVSSTPGASVYRYPGLPRARLVGEALVVSSNEVLNLLFDEERYDPGRQTILTEDPGIELGGVEGLAGGVRWLERTPNRHRLEVEVTGPALLVISENWYPSWRAQVDGTEVPVLRADHTFRAIALEEGRHSVEFWVQSDLLRGTFVLNVFSILVLLGLAGGSVLMQRQAPAGRTPMNRGTPASLGEGEP